MFPLYDIIQQTCLVCTCASLWKNYCTNMCCSIGLSLIWGHFCVGTWSNKRPPICLLVSLSSYVPIIQYGMYFNSTQFLELLPSCFNDAWSVWGMCQLRMNVTCAESRNGRWNEHYCSWTPLQCKQVIDLLCYKYWRHRIGVITAVGHHFGVTDHWFMLQIMMWHCKHYCSRTPLWCKQVIALLCYK